MYFEDNPFYLLKANPKDNRTRIIALADDAAFEIDSIKANEARSILSNPRKRLEAEVSWLPGNINELNKELLEIVSNKNDLNKLTNRWKLNPLCFANLLANLISVTNNDFENIHLIRLLIYTYSEFNLDDIKVLINNDRKTSGYPEIETSKEIEEDVKKRKIFYLSCISKFTSQLSIDTYSSLLISFIEEDDDEALLLSSIIDSFELQFKQFVLQEEENVLKLLKDIRTCITSEYEESSLKKLVLKLNKELREWDKFVQPIQLSTQRRGLEHIQSRDLAMKVRNLAIELNNKYGETKLARLIALNLEDVFQEVTSIFELAGNDAEDLRLINYKDDVISKLVEYITAIRSKSEVNPSQALNFSEEFIGLCSPILLKIKEGNDDELYIQASDLIARCLNGLAIIYGNTTKGFKEAIPYLNKALLYESKADTKETINKNLNIYKQNIKGDNDKPDKSDKEATWGCLIILGFLTIPIWINFWPLIMIVLTVTFLAKDTK